MIWLAWLAIAILLALLDVWAKGSAYGALLLCAAGLVAVWLAKIGLSEPAFWLFSALVWVVIGVVIASLSGGLFAIPALLLVVAGVLVFPARLMGAEYAPGNFWLASSDFCGVLALLTLGWPGIVDLGDRVRDLGRNFGSGNMGDSVHSQGGEVPQVGPDE